MKIEIPKRTDFSRITEIVSQVQNQHIEYRPDIFKPCEFPISFDDFNSMILKKEIFVYKNDEMILGYIALKVLEKNSYVTYNHKTLLVDMLVVDKNHHNKGIGQTLMNFAKDKAKELHCTALELTVSPENIAAIKFYEKQNMKQKTIKYSMYI